MPKLILILLAWLVPAVQAGTRRAYLPVTGPVPLRFQTTRPPGMTNLVLPPLDPGKFAEEPEITRASPTNSLASATNLPPKTVAATTPSLAPAPQPPVTSAPTNAPAPTVITAAPAPAPEPPNPDVMSAQKLVQFFKFSTPSTNGNNTAVVVPVQFAPPPPAATPGSSATYRSP